MKISRLPLRARAAGTEHRRAPNASGGVRARIWAAALLLGAAAVIAMPARATLGEDPATVETDRAQMHATVQRENRAAFAVHTLSYGGNATVREYLSPAGVVFAVSWSTSSMPNLQQLLGVHFATFTSSPHRQAGGRGHLTVQEGSLVVESNGRMRSFHGRAYLNNAIPAGVSINDIE